jgi:hypothetical protein
MVDVFAITGLSFVNQRIATQLSHECAHLIGIVIVFTIGKGYFGASLGKQRCHGAPDTTRTTGYQTTFVVERWWWLGGRVRLV